MPGTHGIKIPFPITNGRWCTGKDGDPCRYFFNTDDVHQGHMSATTILTGVLNLI